MIAAPAAALAQIRAELQRTADAARDAWMQAPVGEAAQQIDAYHRAWAALTNFDMWCMPAEPAKRVPLRLVGPQEVSGA